MSESEVVNTNNNSTDEIVTKDPKNDSLKRKDNEVWSNYYYYDMTWHLPIQKSWMKCGARCHQPKCVVFKVDNSKNRIKQWPPLLSFNHRFPFFCYEYLDYDYLQSLCFLFLCFSFYSIQSFLRIPIRFWIPSTMKAIIRKPNMKMAPKKNRMTQMMPVSYLSIEKCPL